MAFFVGASMVGGVEVFVEWLDREFNLFQGKNLISFLIFERINFISSSPIQSSSVEESDVSLSLGDPIYFEF